MSTTDDTTTPPLYHGSCHCGQVKYQARLDLTTPASPPGIPTEPFILTRCNCSYCLKSGVLLAIPAPGSLSITPSAPDAETNYTFHRGIIKHPFCRKCGIPCYLEGEVKRPGSDEVIKVARINVQTLDGRVDGKPMESLKDIKVRYWDGKDDEFAKGTGAEPWEKGVW